MIKKLMNVKGCLDTNSGHSRRASSTMRKSIEQKLNQSPTARHMNSLLNEPIDRLMNTKLYRKNVQAIEKPTLSIKHVDINN